MEEGKEYNDIYDKISPGTMSRGFIEDKLSSDNLEELLAQDRQEVTDLISINELIYEQSNKRLIRILRLLIKQETIDLISNNNKDIIDLIFKSNNHLRTFAELILEDLISLENNNIVMTTLCVKMITAISEGIYD